MLSERHIRAELEASPSKIVLLVNSAHQGNEPSKFHSSFVPLPSGQPGWDHIAVAWLDQNGELQFGQMVQGAQLVGYGERLSYDLFGSVSNPGSLGELLSDYGAVRAIPFDLSPYRQEVRDVFVNKLEEALKPGNIYSFLDNGHNCTSAVFWALGEAFKEIAPIGTGLGLNNRYALRTLRNYFPGVPLIIDAGIGAPSHAAEAMEMGYDAVLLNTAVSKARDPVRMAWAFSTAIAAGRAAFEAGLMEARDMAQPSTPVAGTPFFELGGKA